jgi:predicted nucleotide-binding protein
MNLLSKPDVKTGQLRFFVHPVRSHLAKIYGKESPELMHFSPVPPDLPDAYAANELRKRLQQLKFIVERLESLLGASVQGKQVFIGHGRSPLWRELKDFVADRLGLPWDEFNREAAAGITTSERLNEMLSGAGFALLILTAEEERSDGTLHARSNVVHEVGLFQGRLGLRRAIVLLEEGCAEFSNITGLSQIRFPRGDVAARFEEIRRVMEREGII